MSLATQLSTVYNGFVANGPKEFSAPILAGNAAFKASFDPTAAIQPGQTLPRFTLPNAVGTPISSADLLAKGPLLITFYRGEWCPFCNLALSALQKQLPAFAAKGVTLVAISPQLPNHSLSTAEKNGLAFPVLSDAGNAFARELGIIFKMPQSLRPIFEKFGHDLLASNGDDSFEVPVPVTLLVGRDGVVRNTFVETDYAKRLEPATALEWIEAL